MKSKKRKSKKRSLTNESYIKQLENHIFFVDRSSGRKKLAQGLRRLGLNVITHDELFRDTTTDIEWLTHCGVNNWVVISSDLSIKKNLLERNALLSAKVASFFFTSASFNTEQQIKAFSKSFKKIANYVLRVRRPFIARIFKDGTFELWINHKGEDCIKKKQERKKRNEKKNL